MPGGLSPQAFRVMVAIVVGLLVLGAATGALLHRLQPHASASSPTAVPIPGVSNRAVSATDAELMGLTSLQHAPATGFTLTDQAGRRVSLGQLDAAHAVVLTFFDARCIDVCPIVAHEIATADAALGAAARKVDFVAVNINPLHTSVASVRAFDSEHVLAGVPNFYFLTGTPRSLQPVWAAYHVTVKVEQPSQVILHSEAMYFVAPGGRLLYEATPFADERPNGTGYLPAPTEAQWSAAIAKYARVALGGGGSAATKA